MLKYFNRAEYTVGAASAVAGSPYACTVRTGYLGVTSGSKVTVILEESSDRTIYAIANATITGTPNDTISIISTDIIESSEPDNSMPSWAGALNVRHCLDARTIELMTNGGYDVVLAISQSNMVNRSAEVTFKKYVFNEGNYADNVYQLVLSHYLTVDNLVDVSEADLHSKVVPVRRRLYHYEGNTTTEAAFDDEVRSTGIAGGFARAYAQSEYCLGRKVLIIPMAVAGSGFSSGAAQWYYGGTYASSGAYWKKAVDEVDAILADGKSRIVAILACCGEDETGAHPSSPGYNATFADDYKNAIDGFRSGAAGGGFAETALQPDMSTVPFISGEMSQEWIDTLSGQDAIDAAAIQNVLQNVQYNIAYSAYVDGSTYDNDLETVTVGSIHRSSIDLLNYGQAFFDQYSSALTNTLVPFAPTAPTNVQASSTTANEIIFTWNQGTSIPVPDGNDVRWWREDLNVDPNNPTDFTDGSSGTSIAAATSYVATVGDATKLYRGGVRATESTTWSGSPSSWSTPSATVDPVDPVTENANAWALFKLDASDAGEDSGGGGRYWNSVLASAVSDTGTAQSGTSTTIQLKAASTYIDDELNQATINITGGTGSGQSRTITDYVQSTDTATVNPAWGTTPDATSTYEIIPIICMRQPDASKKPNYSVSNGWQTDIDANPATEEVRFLMLNDMSGSSTPYGGGDVPPVSTAVTSTDGTTYLYRVYLLDDGSPAATRYLSGCFNSHTATLNTSNQLSVTTGASGGTSVTSTAIGSSGQNAIVAWTYANDGTINIYSCNLTTGAPTLIGTGTSNARVTGANWRGTRPCGFGNWATSNNFTTPGGSNYSFQRYLRDVRLYETILSTGDIETEAKRIIDGL